MLAYASGELCFEGCRLAPIASTFDTPFFLLGEARLLGNLRALREGLAEGGAPGVVRYTAKASNELAVLRCLHAAGVEAMVSHVDEARLALRAGFAPSDLWLQRPFLQPDEVRATLRLGVDGFHVCCPEDVDALDEATRREGATARVALRLRPGGGLSPLRFLSARLGLDRREAKTAAVTLRDSPRAEVVGMNVYAGTQLRSPRRLVAETRRMIELAGSLAAEAGIRLSEIIVSGGVPSPSLRLVRPATLLSRLRDVPPAGLRNAFTAGHGDASAAGHRDASAAGHRDASANGLQDDPRRAGSGEGTIREFARTLAVHHAAACRREGLEPAPRLVLEVGRCLVGDAGVLVTRVLGRRGRWLFVDASRGHLPESPLRFWRPVLPARAPSSRRRRVFHVAGGRVNTTDVIEPWRRLPPLDAGELLAIGAAGAYSTARADRYAGLLPRVVWLDSGGSLRTVRRPEGVEDLAAPMSQEDRSGAGGETVR